MITNSFVQFQLIVLNLPVVIQFYGVTQLQALNFDNDFVHKFAVCAVFNETVRVPDDKKGVVLGSREFPDASVWHSPLHQAPKN